MRASGAALVAVYAAVIALSIAYLPHSAVLRHRVAVIGGGLAGLSAATTLSANGIDVVVLEAQDYVGGRVKSSSGEHFVAELGASFLHTRGLAWNEARVAGDTTSHPVWSLLHKFNTSCCGGVDRNDGSIPLRLHHYNYSRGTYIDFDGTPFSRVDWLRLRDDFTEVIFHDFLDKVEEMRQRSGLGGDQPMSVTLEDLNGNFYENELDEREQRLFDLFCFQHIVQDMQAPLQEISSMGYDGSAESTILEEKDFLIVGGIGRALGWWLHDSNGAVHESTDAMQTAGAAHRRTNRRRRRGGSLDVFLNSPVNRIDWGSDVEAECELISGTLMPDFDPNGASVNRMSRLMYESIMLADEFVCLALAALRKVARWGLGSSVNDFITGGIVNVSVAVGAREAQQARTVAADAVVVAVPLGVLKSSLASAVGGDNGAISFVPPLPNDIAHAITDLGLLPAHRIVLCWAREEVFWSSNDTTTAFFFKYANKDLSVRPPAPFGKGEHVEIINIDEAVGNGCLAVGAEGDLASALAASTRDEAVARVMADLQLAFGRGKSTPLPQPSRVFHADWATNPFIRGGYSHHRVDSGADENLEFTFPIYSRLYFAGEHCDADHYGSMHGAMFSGERAALAIQRSITWMAAILGFIVVAVAEATRRFAVRYTALTV